VAGCSALPAWRRRAKPLLGTVVDISLPADMPDAAFTQATDAAFARVAQVQACMSFHEAFSDVRALARTPAGTRLQVAPDTWAVLQQALDWETRSAGLFNVCIAPALVATGQLPQPQDALPAQATCLRQALVLVPGLGVEVRATPWIDLGGIAKGHAVDCAVQALQDAGVARGLVNAGGDMRAFGSGAHPVHLRFASGLRQVANLHNGALAASCNAADRRPPHINPHNGKAVRSPHSVLVHAPTASWADAFSKIALLCPTTAQRLCQAPGGQASPWRVFDFFDGTAAAAAAATAPACTA
jgi:FAD:protein FMN transferase